MAHKARFYTITEKRSLFVFKKKVKESHTVKVDNKTWKKIKMEAAEDAGRQTAIELYVEKQFWDGLFGGRWW